MKHLHVSLINVLSSSLFVSNVEKGQRNSFAISTILRNENVAILIRANLFRHLLVLWSISHELTCQFVWNVATYVDPVPAK